MIAARVLFIDDDPLYVGRTCAALRDAADVRVARRGDPDLWQEAAAWQPHVVVVNAFEAASASLPVHERLRADNPAPERQSPSVICVASGAGAISHSQSTCDGFYAVVRRAEGPDGLLPLLHSALKLHTSGMSTPGDAPQPTA